MGEEKTTWHKQAKRSHASPTSPTEKTGGNTSNWKEQVQSRDYRKKTNEAITTESAKMSLRTQTPKITIQYSNQYTPFYNNCKHWCPQFPIQKIQLWLSGLRDKMQCFCCLQKTHLIFLNRYYLRVDGIENNFPSNWSRKQADINSPLSVKIDFKSKWIRKDREGHFMVSKEQLTKTTL